MTGFIICVVTGLMFVTGVRANVPMSPYDVIKSNVWLQLKFLFIALAGTEPARVLRDGHEPRRRQSRSGRRRAALAKVIAFASLFLWLGVIYFGRLIPEGL